MCFRPALKPTLKTRETQLVAIFGRPKPDRLLDFFKNCRDPDDEGDKLRDNRAMDPKRPLGHLVWVAFTGAFLLP